MTPNSMLGAMSATQLNGHMRGAYQSLVLAEVLMSSTMTVLTRFTLVSLSIYSLIMSVYDTRHFESFVALPMLPVRPHAFPASANPRVPCQQTEEQQYVMWRITMVVKCDQGFISFKAMHILLTKHPATDAIPRWRLNQQRYMQPYDTHSDFDCVPFLLSHSSHSF